MCFVTSYSCSAPGAACLLSCALIFSQEKVLHLDGKKSGLSTDTASSSAPFDSNRPFGGESSMAKEVKSSASSIHILQIIDNRPTMQYLPS